MATNPLIALKVNPVDPSQSLKLGYEVFAKERANRQAQAAAAQNHLFELQKFDQLKSHQEELRRLRGEEVSARATAAKALAALRNEKTVGEELQNTVDRESQGAQIATNFANASQAKIKALQAQIEYEVSKGTAPTKIALLQEELNNLKAQTDKTITDSRFINAKTRGQEIDNFLLQTYGPALQGLGVRQAEAEIQKLFQDMDEAHKRLTQDLEKGSAELNQSKVDLEVSQIELRQKTLGLNTDEAMQMAIIQSAYAKARKLMTETGIAEATAPAAIKKAILQNDYLISQIRTNEELANKYIQTGLTAAQEQHRLALENADLEKAQDHNSNVNFAYFVQSKAVGENTPAEQFSALAKQAGLDDEDTVFWENAIKSGTQKEIADGLLAMGALDTRGGGVNINIGKEPTIPGTQEEALKVHYVNGEAMVGNVPFANYALKEGMLVVDPKTNTFRAVPVEDSKLARELKAEADRQNKLSAERIRSTSDMIWNVNRAIDDVSFWNTGWFAQLTEKLGSTPARDFASNIDTILSELGFSELAEMRENSKSGGALGSVTERELELLQSTIASLKWDNSDGNLTDNLKILRHHLSRLRALENGTIQTFKTEEDAFAALANTANDTDIKYYAYGRTGRVYKVDYSVDEQGNNIAIPRLLTKGEYIREEGDRGM